MKKVMLSIMVLFVVGTQYLSAASKEVLDLEIKETIQKFEKKAKGGKEFLDKQPGYLVIPNLYKAGFVVGGEYGEGGLIESNTITAYYQMVSASFGLEAGAQKRSLIIVFLTPSALESFKKSNKWKVGVDGSISLVDWGHTLDLSTIDFKKSIVAFAFDNKGLMASLSIDGSVFSKIKK